MAEDTEELQVPLDPGADIVRVLARHEAIFLALMAGPPVS